MIRYWLAGAAVVFLATAAAAQPVERLDVIRVRGHLVCGVPRDFPGFAAIQDDARVAGFDADLCRGIAAVIFGSGDAVRFVALDHVEEFLAAPDIDLVFHQLTWKFTRELIWGLTFGPVVFHDGQTFLVQRTAGIVAAHDLAGRRICVEEAPPFAPALREYLRTRRIEASLVLATTPADAARRFFAGECDAWSADASMLIAWTARADAAANYQILPERFSNEPLAPILRTGDLQLLAVVRWTFYAMLAAEMQGISSGNVTARAAAAIPEQTNLLYLPQSLSLGLAPNWVEDLIREVGNYGEVYGRHFTGAGRVAMDRGANRLWTEGGLLFAPPLY